MKIIINELRKSSEHELSMVGLIPSTNFVGTQYEHDEYHRNRSMKYEEAAEILERSQVKKPVQAEQVDMSLYELVPGHCLVCAFTGSICTPINILKSCNATSNTCYKIKPTVDDPWTD